MEEEEFHSAYDRLSAENKTKFDETWSNGADATYDANYPEEDDGRYEHKRYNRSHYSQGSISRRDDFGTNPGQGNIPGGGQLGNYPFSPSMVTGLGSFSRFGIDKQRIASCMFAVKDFGIIKNVKDIMIDFSSEGFTVEHTNAVAQRFLRSYVKATKFDDTLNEIFDMFYTTANTFIWETPATIPNAKINEFKRTMGVKTDYKTKGDVTLPWKYTILNPLNIETIGSRLMGTFQYGFNLSDADMRVLNTKGDPNARQGNDLDNRFNTQRFPETQNVLPEEFRSMIKKDKNGNFKQVVPLDSDRLDVLFYKKLSTDTWAVPPLWPALEDVDFKRTLRLMDRSSAWAIMHGVTVFKLGDIKNGIVPGKKEFQKLSKMLAQPTWGMNIVWNEAISIESIYPDLGNQFGVAKYESVDRDILAALGISEVLTNGRGGNFANSFLSVKTLLERLQYGRNIVKTWAEEKLSEVCRIMGFRNCNVKVKFGKMSLRDERAEKELMIKLVDRNLVSRETVLRTFDESLDIEGKRMQKEDELVDQGKLPPKYTPLSNTDFGILEDDDPRLPGNDDVPVGGPEGENGRPPGTDDTPQEKERETKPQGLGIDLMTVAKVNYARVESVVSAKYLKNKGVKYWKALSKEQREQLDSIIYRVFSNVPCRAGLTNEVITKLLGKLPSPLNGIDSICKSRLKEFISKENRKPNMAEIREMRSASSAIYYSNI